MAKVGIVMGSDSDMPVMAKAADILEKLGIDYPLGDTPDVTREQADWARGIIQNGIDACR